MAFQPRFKASKFTASKGFMPGPLGYVSTPAYTGVSFDGASTTGQAPTLTNSNRTAEFIVSPAASVLAAVISTQSKATGKWYFPIVINKVPTTGTGLTGIGDATLNVNSLGTTVNHAWGLLVTSTAYQFGNAVAPGNPGYAPAPANGDNLIIYADFDAHTCGVILPDNTAYNMVGTISTSTFNALALISTTASTIDYQSTIALTTPLTPPVGYTNWAA